jgi:hypothetical protein
MEDVAGVSKQIGIGIGTGTAVSRLLPMMREVERVRSRKERMRRAETSNSFDKNLHYLFGIKHCSLYSMSKTVAKQKLNRVKASKRQHQIETATIQVDIYG